MRALKIIGLIVMVLILIYFAGPKPVYPEYKYALPAIPASAQALEKYIQQKENSHRLKPDNQARIIWNDSSKIQTEYAVIYLHGFSASQEEGDPVHTAFAKTFGCNLYLSRLAEHGVDTTEAMINLTADKLWNSAKEAVAIGKQLGKKVIVMSTSTGGTLALKLAANYPDIAGLILLSPNVAINDGSAWVLNNPWGLQIAKMIKGNYMVSKDTTKIYKQYWDNKYRIEATTELEELIETTMKASVFEKVTQPVLLLYYYKDEEHQDPVVKVSAMLRMFKQLGTPVENKRAIAIPNAGDHVIGSYIKSKDVKTVEAETIKFGKEILHLQPVEKSN
ncbi:MAG TPA: alpha/beta hydrolase [Chitinophagaceae bacterium]